MTNAKMNALSSKLRDVGRYTEALMDYIKKLLSNNKSKADLVADLTLFLQNDTEQFVDWLFDLIESINNAPHDEIQAVESDSQFQTVDVNNSVNQHVGMMPPSSFDHQNGNGALSLNNQPQNDNLGIDSSSIVTHNEITMDDELVDTQTNHPRIHDGKAENKSRFNRFMKDIKRVNEQPITAHKATGTRRSVQKPVRPKVTEKRWPTRLRDDLSNDLRNVIDDLKLTKNKGSCDGIFVANVMDVPTVSPPPPPPLSDNVHLMGTITDDMMTAAVQKPLPDAIRISNGRCKFWPSCKNVNNDCVYYHPTIPCMKFPNCVYGNKCLYIHPVCKFGENCTNQNCTYTHLNRPTKRSHIPNNVQHPTKNLFTYNADETTSSHGCLTSSPMSNGAKSTNTSFGSIPCKYGANCRNKQCHFKHPNRDNNGTTIRSDSNPAMKYLAPDLVSK